MHCPVSPAITNKYMEYFEKSVLGPLCPIPTPLWKRYVDNVICIVKKDQVDILFKHINQMDAHINLQWSLQIVKEVSLFWIPSAPLTLITPSTPSFIENQLTQTDT